MSYIKLVIIVIFFSPFSVAGQPSGERKVPHLPKPRNEKAVKNTYDEDVSNLSSKIKPIRKKLDSIYKLVRTNDDLRKKSDSSVKTLIGQELNILNMAADQLKLQIITVQFNFIRNNPSSRLSLERLTMLLMNNGDTFLSDTFQLLFNNLRPNLKNSESGREFELLLGVKEKNEAGNLSTDFRVNDINGKEISIISFRDKSFVLLDFWASWCSPCREDIPYLKDLYKQYHEKGFDIIAISQDDNLLNWRNAIAMDSTEEWKHVLSQNGGKKINSSILVNYFIYGIPVKVLINRQGVVVGRWSGSGEENIVSLKTLLHKALDKR